MKIAVITPYYKEKAEILSRCHQSVLNQTYEQITHIMVADGDPHPMVEKLQTCEHLILPYCHNDAGATPRAIGALSAFSRHYDCIAFLDADNTYEDNHIEIMVNNLGNRDVLTATRNIRDLNRKLLYVDTVESNGDTFCDTNCLFLTKNVMHLLHNWIVPEHLKLWSDRIFWTAIKGNTTSIAHVSVPTVNYYSRWAWHYQYAGVTPPDSSVWIDQTSEGKLIYKQHQNS